MNVSFYYGIVFKIRKKREVSLESLFLFWSKLCVLYKCDVLIYVFLELERNYKFIEFLSL